jgi:hypothetical protein
MIAALLLPLLSLAVAQQPPACVDLPRDVEIAIKKHATEHRAAEWCDTRKVDSGDLNSDGLKDIVVSYSLEGACPDNREAARFGRGGCGNDALQFLSVFLKTPTGYREVPPISFGPAIVTLKIEGTVIKLETLDWTARDAHCCPSKKGEARFTIRRGRLTPTHPNSS